MSSRASCGVTPAWAKMCSRVALRCSVSHWRQNPLSAACIAAASAAACSWGKCGVQISCHSAWWSKTCQGVSVPPQSKITAATAMRAIVRTGTVTAEAIFRAGDPSVCGRQELAPTVCRARGDPDAVGTVPEIRDTSRTETVVQCSWPRATVTEDWMKPQPLTGNFGLSFCPVELISTTAGGISARAGHMVPGLCPVDGCRRAVTSALRLPSARSSVAVDHRPLPAMAWTLSTHRSTVTGTKDAGRVPVGAPDGQPAQATSPAGRDPPLTVGTGVAVPLAAGADPETPGALAEAPLAGAELGPLVPDAVAPDVPGEAELPGAWAPAGALAQPAASAPAASSVTAAAQARRPDLFRPFAVIM